MSGAEIGLVAFLGVLAALVVCVLVGPRPAPPLPSNPVGNRVRNRVVVTLKSGDAFTGILWEADDRAWVLRGAEAVGEGENHTDLPVDGEIILMTADIAYAQKP